MKSLVVCDLDGTLAESKSPLDEEMATLLHALLGVVRVAVISGGDWPQFETQLIDRLPHDERLRGLSLLPTCGTKFYRYDGTWSLLYAETFTAAEKGRIVGALDQAFAIAGFTVDRTWGEVIEDRGSQITFSALGQQAPLDVKREWDPDFAKRQRMKGILDPLLPGFSVRLGGTTSIDITRLGIDKGYGIRKLRDTLGIGLEEMVFLGDALFPGGNDYPAAEAGVLAIRVRDPEESKRVIQAITGCLEGVPRVEPPLAVTR